MAPLFYFLASSLNVELVYIILKSVTQFVNINPMSDSYCPGINKQMKINKRNSNSCSLGGNNHVTLELSKIKIKNYSNWTSASGSDLYQNEHLGKCKYFCDKEANKLI